MSLESTFKRFLSHHSEELSSIGGILSAILNTSAIHSLERHPLEVAAAALSEGASRIRESIAAMDAGSDEGQDNPTSVNAVRQMATDAVLDVLASDLPGIVEAAVQKHLALIQPPASAAEAPDFRNTVAGSVADVTNPADDPQPETQRVIKTGSKAAKDGTKGPGETSADADKSAG